MRQRLQTARSLLSLLSRRGSLILERGLVRCGLDIHTLIRHDHEKQKGPVLVCVAHVQYTRSSLGWLAGPSLPAK